MTDVTLYVYICKELLLSKADKMPIQMSTDPLLFILNNFNYSTLDPQHFKGNAILVMCLSNKDT